MGNMRSATIAIGLLLCVAAGPASQPTTQPVTKEMPNGKIVVDAKAGPDVLLEVRKGDVYTFTATGKWSNGGKPFGPEGHPHGAITSGLKIIESSDMDDFLHAHFSAMPDDEWVKVGKGTKWKAPDDGILKFDALDGEKASGQITVTVRRTAIGKR